MSKKSSNLFFLGFFLCAVCAVATAVMGGAALFTRGPIEQAQMRKVAHALHQVLPPFDNDILKEVKTVSDVRFYTARKQGVVVGYAGELSVKSGYGGLMKALISFRKDGAIRTFVVTQHSETPGLGSAAVERLTPVSLAGLFTGKKKTADGSLAPNAVLDQYSSHKLTGPDSWRRPWRLTKDGGDVQYITGATISSRAVNDLAWKAVSAFNEFIALEKKSTGKPANKGGSTI